MNPMTSSDPIRVLVVDDHTLFRRGLIALLATQPRLQVVGEAGDAGAAERLATELQPQVILLDNHLPGVSGVQALPALKAAAPGCQVLMLTMSESEADLGAALGEAGIPALLAVIGPDWLDARDAQGHRRLDDPRDFVRVEVETALRRGVRVVPVLVKGAAMPNEADLPAPLAGLAHRHALPLRSESFHFDVDRLLAAVEPKKKPAHLRVLATVAGMLLLVAAASLAFTVASRGFEPAAEDTQAARS